jgi:hypothetical protein
VLDWGGCGARPPAGALPADRARSLQSFVSARNSIGFLKRQVRLFATPLTFDAGALVLSPGFHPVIDRAVLAAHETAREGFAPPIGSLANT